jgi:uncharacterized membrane protein YphA (DoxX/SURF4 family)/peroxiredoxin
MKYLLWLLRIVVGVLFIFSGLIKANDPLGLSYKMDEFFEVWHMYWMMPYSLALSITMIAFEIIAGMALLVGYGFRIFSFLLLLLTTFFTFLTAYVYLTDKIKECGCFGDCIKISNAETFWKDVILLVFVLILFVYRKRIKPVFSGYPSTAILILTTFFAFGMQWWVLEHLPFYDCLPYKVGANLWTKTQLPPDAEPAVYETILTYEKDGVQQDFTMDNYPWQDTNWKYVDTKTRLVKEATGEIEIKDFTIRDYDGNDHTENILRADGYVFLLFVRNTDKARTDNLDRLKNLADQAEALGIPTYILSSDNQERTTAFLHQHNLMKFPVFAVDGTASKTGMRTNPGLMLLHDGTVQHKWSFRDYPAGVTINNGRLDLK